MQSHDEQHRQKRSHLKVRTGCATCKTRRVKCDETHPECTRCRTANRKCVYAVPKTWLFEPKKGSPTIQNQPSIALGNVSEQRAFQFFKEKTAPQFSGNHELAQKFWTKFIVGMATEDPLIFRLAVAMGARHEATMRRSEESSDLATASHAMVLSTLARHLTTMRVEISLLCCAMLMGYANLCEEVPATAAIHFSLGLKILREETIEGPRGISDSMGLYIFPMFAELELGTSLFRVPPYEVEMVFSDIEGQPSMPRLPDFFTNLYEAKQSLANIHRWRLYVSIQNRLSSTEYLTEIAKVDQLLVQWRQCLERYAASVAGLDPSAFFKARKMLFQYKLFIMCNSAAKNEVFKDACRVQMVSVDFTRPNLTSVLCHLQTVSSDSSWTPLGIRDGREKDDLDIWPQGVPVGQDGNAQIIRITLGC